MSTVTIGREGAVAFVTMTTVRPYRLLTMVGVTKSGGSESPGPPRPQDVQATFCATLVDEWIRLGVRHAVVAPGSRSTPMALALAERAELAVHVVHDERVAAFVALGLGLDGGRRHCCCARAGPPRRTSSRRWSRPGCPRSR